ncbi:hypothetical protein [Natrinema ejinorense]|uniref:Uncharacterized protein n=1 Tax=Natrinema ejinorense TaxID=373386 RepID=A0A2A5QUA0_9EURY|nr:hypothetical protein [Natrinema ejinorense]PCR90416.1 hypothetical protein CP557_07685 [Natrinema ejinorense]
MKLSDIPIVGQVLKSGAEDRVFDSLLLVGLVLIPLIAVVGRSLFTTGTAIVYIALFVGYVFYKGIRGEMMGDGQ